MSEYVRKLRVAVTVSQAGEDEPFEGLIALAVRAQFHAGPETLLERLNASDRVIPVERDGDDVFLFNRLEIEWVLPGADVTADLLGPEVVDGTREERVRLRLRSGERLEGMLQIDLPDYLNRVSDFMNGPEHFFPLVTDQGIYFVNKLAVLSARLYESSPEPVRESE